VNADSAETTSTAEDGSVDADFSNPEMGFQATETYGPTDLDFGANPVAAGPPSDDADFSNPEMSHEEVDIVTTADINNEMAAATAAAPSAPVDPAAQSGPPTAVGPFDHSTGRRSTVGYTSKHSLTDGVDLAVTGGYVHEEQTGYNNETVTEVNKDGVIGSAEIKAEFGKRTVVGASIEGQYGHAEVTTTAPGFTQEASGTYGTVKGEVKGGIGGTGKGTVAGVPISGGGALVGGGNVTVGGTDLSYTSHTVQADQSVETEVGTTDQDDIAVRGLGGGEFKGSLGRGSIGVKGQVEIGASYTTEHREATITNSGKPDAYSTEISDTEVVAVEGLVYGEIKAGAASRGGVVSGRGYASGAFSFYEGKTTQRTDYESGQEVGGSLTEATDYTAPIAGSVYSYNATDSYTLDDQGNMATSERTETEEHPFTDTRNTSSVAVEDDGTITQVDTSVVDGTFVDSTASSYTTYSPDGTVTTTSVATEDGFLSDTTVTTDRSVAVDGTVTETVTTEVEGVFSTEVTETTRVTSPTGGVTTSTNTTYR
jgi:hypothetical protein